MIKSINPATGAVLKEYKPHDKAAIDSALTAAAKAQRAWGGTPLAERLPLLKQIARVLRENKKHYSELISLEMGKPIAEAEGEIEKCAWTCDVYAEMAPKYLAPDVVDSNASYSEVVYDPLGVVLAVMPWNYPFWQFFRFAIPAFAAGNGAILKHASNVPQCAVAIEEVVRKAGAPDGLMATLLISASEVAALIGDDRIAAVTLTGSTEVGSLVAAEAGKHLKKQVLELGGSDPFIVLADADIDAAAQTAAKARFQNVGQSCIAAKRFIVESSVIDKFSDALCGHVKKMVVGDPLDRKTTIGPMARANLRDDLHDQVQRSIKAGARLRMGGTIENNQGAFYPPTVLDNVAPDMAAFDEETFGPVAAIVRADSADHAIELANKTEYGLGAALWTGDTKRGRELAHRIEAGAVFINGMVASDARLPFGGVKKSGYGRELGAYGIKEFTNTKTIWVGPVKA